MALKPRRGTWAYGPDAHTPVDAARDLAWGGPVRICPHGPGGRRAWSGIMSRRGPARGQPAMGKLRGGTGVETTMDVVVCP